MQADLPQRRRRPTIFLIERDEENARRRIGSVGRERNESEMAQERLHEQRRGRVVDGTTFGRAERLAMLRVP